NKQDLSAYRRSIEWSDEDQSWVGRCPELFAGGCHGDSKEAVTEQLEEIIADVAADYAAAGKPLPEPIKRAPSLANAVNARKVIGVDQKRFADLLGVNVGTVRKWEQGQEPKGTAATLLRIIEKRPDVLDASDTPQE